MRLNSWYRLCIIISIIYLCVLSYFSFLNFPSHTYVSHNDSLYADIDTKAIVRDDARVEINVVKVVMPNDYIITFKAGTPKDVIKEVELGYRYALEQKASVQLAEERKYYLFSVLLGWVIPCTIISLIRKRRRSSLNTVYSH